MFNFFKRAAPPGIIDLDADTQWERERRALALEKAFMLHFGEAGPTTDDPMLVARAAATFDRFLADGTVAECKVKLVE